MVDDLLEEDDAEVNAAGHVGHELGDEVFDGRGRSRRRWATVNPGPAAKPTRCDGVGIRVQTNRELQQKNILRKYLTWGLSG
jgi:hypothetical protein